MPDGSGDTDRQAKVVLLVGPSGCGKTYLARASGLPVVALDDFYRAATESGLPRTDDGDVDWEDPRAWDAEAALVALATLCTGEAVEVPRYSLPESRPIGTQVIARHGAAIVIAEGIFASELIDPLRNRGLLADALLLRQNRWLTFVRRLRRDLREDRKGVVFLLRQGCAKTWAEPRVVAHQLAHGARPVSKAEASARLAELST